MEKRLLLAFGLSFLILVTWQYFLAPRHEPPVPSPAPGSEVVEAAETAPPPTEAGSAAAATEQEPPAEAGPAVEAEAEVTTVVETDLFRVELTNRGGRARSWSLSEFSTDGVPLEIIPEAARAADLFPLAVDLDDPALTERINAALMRVEREPVDAMGERVRYHWSDGRGLDVEKSFTFRDGDPLVDVRLEVVDRGRRLPARLTVGPGFEANDRPSSGSSYHYHGQAVFDVGGTVERRKREKVETAVALRDVPGLRWAGLEEQYFATLLIPEGSAASTLVIRPYAIARAAAPDEEAKPEPQLAVAVTIPPEGARLFVGPKRYGMLRDLGSDLQRVVWYSSYALFAVPARWLHIAVLWVHDNIVANYGLAIVLTTLALRILLFPLNQYSMVSMRKMQQDMGRLQPKINAIKAKYRKQKDAQARGKMNEEMMALYRKEGVNPAGSMSGCLPMLIQFPILIAFYYTLQVAVELRGAPFFGWITDLTAKDPFYVTPILMGATMFIQQKLSATKGGDPAQQRIMLMMPVVFTVMFLNLPSGLVLYWFVNNLLGIGQQWIVNRRLGQTAPAVKKA